MTNMIQKTQLEQHKSKHFLNLIIHFYQKQPDDIRSSFLRTSVFATQNKIQTN